MHGVAALKVNGRELFTREWIADDPRSHGGDGLGPLFNDTSCVACHNQGGVGGAGPEAKNARIVTVLRAQSGDDPFSPADSFTLPGMPGPVPENEASSGDESQTLAAAPMPDARSTTSAPSTAAVIGSTLAKAITTITVPNARAAAIRQRLLQDREELQKIHPGFRTARSLILHLGSTDPEYLLFRDKFGPAALLDVRGGRGMPGMMMMPGMSFMQMPGESGPELSDSQVRDFARRKLEAQMRRRNPFHSPPTIGRFTFLVSERNTPALFGSGEMDTIPDHVLMEAAARKYRKFPEINGRVARLRDGRIGRFGWKAQEASLRDFVFTACAVELGLEVPGEHQAALPHRPDYVAPGLDLTELECNELVRFVAGLPAPQARTPDHEIQRRIHVRGQQLFAEIGCAACHTPQLGEVAGIYSDLLLHDMGSENSDSGSYGVFQQDSSEEDEFDTPVPLASEQQITQSGRQAAERIGATRQEWRTPPLWGLRDSAPYMHDGRAENLEQAIALHGGEGLGAARRFFRLTSEQQLHLTTFLRSLTASQ